MADKSAQNVLDSIAASRQRGLDRLLAALGIPHVGNTVAITLAKGLGSLDALASASMAELSRILYRKPKIDQSPSKKPKPDIIAHSVFDYFHGQTGHETVAQLKAAGIDPKMTKPAATGARVLEGKKFVVTGALSHYSRQEIEELIANLGGRASGSVSTKTDYVLAGDEAGNKLADARRLGVAVLSEEEFEKLISLKR
jgi:DNA ligase (NAD+)